MKTLDDKFAELPPWRAERIAELVRGYETGEPAKNPAKNPAIELYAERNGELHVIE